MHWWGAQPLLRDWHSSGSSPHPSVVADHNAIIAHGRLCRNVTGIEIALNEIERPLAGWPIATASACLDQDEIAGREPQALLLLDRSCLAGAAVDKREAAGLSFPAALHAPGRKARAVEVGLHLARPEHAVGLAASEPAPEGTGAAGIGSQREFLESRRQIGFLQLERDDAGVPVRHGPERAAAV